MGRSISLDVHPWNEIRYIIGLGMVFLFLISLSFCNLLGNLIGNEISCSVSQTGCGESPGLDNEAVPRRPIEAPHQQTSVMGGAADRCGTPSLVHLMMLLVLWFEPFNSLYSFSYKKRKNKMCSSQKS